MLSQAFDDRHFKKPPRPRPNFFQAVVVESTPKRRMTRMQAMVARLMAGELLGLEGRAKRRSTGW
jgi:hypothetical protein